MAPDAPAKTSRLNESRVMFVLAADDLNAQGIAVYLLRVFTKSKVSDLRLAQCETRGVGRSIMERRQPGRRPSSLHRDVSLLASPECFCQLHVSDYEAHT